MTAASDSTVLDRRPPPPIPILVLTGFLGAGKTTLLNAWVKTPAFADVAVVINEFGEIALDHLLVEKAEGTILTLSSGCLCCTIRGDLIATLEDLIRRRDNGRVAPFTHVVIETTGLADPAPILNTIMFHPYLPMRYRLDGVVTVIDALHGLTTIESHGEALRQAAVADTLIVSKTDLLAGDADRLGLERRLAQLNPGARLLDANRGEATATAVLAGGLFDLDTRSETVRGWLDPSRYEEDHHHGHGAHRHDVNRHDERIRATCLVSDGPLDPAAFQMFLDLVRGTHGDKLLRLKGIVALRDDPARPLVIHGVQHSIHPAHRLQGWPDADHRSRLILITRDLDPVILERLWLGFFGPPRVDQPDAAAFAAMASHRSGGLLG